MVFVECIEDLSGIVVSAYMMTCLFDGGGTLDLDQPPYQPYRFSCAFCGLAGNPTFNGGNPISPFRGDQK